MNITELAEQLKLPKEYLQYLLTIINGTETQHSKEDEQEAVKLVAQMLTISLDEED